MNDKYIEKTISSIEKHLHNSYGKLNRFQIYKRHRYVFSEVLKIRLYFSKFTQDVVLKRLLPEKRSNSNLALTVELEYCLLRDLYKEFSSLTQINVIKPLIFIPDDHVLVTEDFPGDKLDALIVDTVRWLPSFKTLSSIGYYCFLSGRWLRQFQEFTIDEAPIDLNKDYYINSINNKLESARSHGLEKPLCEEIYAFIDRKFTDIAQQKLKSVGYHSDFSPWNILARNGEIRVLDFDRFSHRCKYDDLTFFLCCLEVNKGIIGMSSRSISYLKENFKAGYDMLDCNNDIFELYLLKNTLKCISAVDIDHYSNTKYVHILYERFRKRRQIKVLLSFLRGILSNL